MKKPTTSSLFNTFIQRNYDGFSAHTLYKFLANTCPKEVASHWVYINIFHVFTNKYTPQDLEISQMVAEIVFNDPNLSDDIHNFRNELIELKFCMEFGYIPNNLAYLKENALDMYLKNAISLNEFELIIKA